MTYFVPIFCQAECWTCSCDENDNKSYRKAPDFQGSWDCTSVKNLTGKVTAPPSWGSSSMMDMTLLYKYNHWAPGEGWQLYLGMLLIINCKENRTGTHLHFPTTQGQSGWELYK